eukprot:TRINITY_DN1543_c0_g1_i9.p2 TRINITY_DN1543_c0_g1~~TRINITY_DN1543_c0_g1_i9.p2  ORF type:complete len:101 (-),score=24.84 TRINITY_DN1543_c0_g1_i9:80-382(-)
MPFSNVPVRNPGRYFEQFVKVVQPITGGNQAAAYGVVNNGPTMAITSSYMTNGANNGQNNAAVMNGGGGIQQQTAQNGNSGANSGQMYGSYGSQTTMQFK